MTIGEAGKLSTDLFGSNQEVRVDFGNSIPNPVVCIRPDLRRDGPADAAPEFRITTCDEHGFGVRMSNTGKAAKASLSPVRWIAISRGTHRLPDGRTIVAGQTTSDADGEDVAFGTPMAQRPVVLKSVLAASCAPRCDTPQRPPTRADDVAEDPGTTTGFIAIAPASPANEYGPVAPNNADALGVMFTDGVVLGQTLIAWGRDRAETRPNQPPGPAIALTPDQSFNARATPLIGEANSLPSSLPRSEPEMIPCFTRDSQIETPDGPRAMRDLRAGDLIVTLDRGLQQVLWISRTRLTRDFLQANPDHRPIRIRRAALGPGQPARELVVSPQHRLVISDLSLRRRFGSDRVLVPASALLDGDGIDVLPPNRGWTYFHLLLPEHCLIQAESCATESLSAQAARSLIPSSRFDHLPIWKSAPPLPVATEDQGREIWARLKCRSQPRIPRDRSRGTGTARGAGFDLHHSA